MSSLREPIKVILDIIKSELGLADGQIMIINQKWNIPSTPGLYVAISYISGKVIANNNYVEPVVNGVVEIQEVTMLETIQIDVLSADASARTRKEEIIQALRSVFSQQAQDSNGLQIARIPSDFLDASSLEETTILNRFMMTINVTSLFSKTKSLGGYYDKFPTEGVNDTNSDVIDFDAQNAPAF